MCCVVCLCDGNGSHIISGKDAVALESKGRNLHEAGLKRVVCSLFLRGLSHGALEGGEFVAAGRLVDHAVDGDLDGDIQGEGRVHGTDRDVQLNEVCSRDQAGVE